MDQFPLQGQQQGVLQIQIQTNIAQALDVQGERQEELQEAVENLRARMGGVARQISILKESVGLWTRSLLVVDGIAFVAMKLMKGK